MASATTIRRPPEQQQAQSLRAQMEELLFAFYHLAGIAPGTSSKSADEMLSDDFQARLFLRVRSEMLNLDKAKLQGATAPFGVPDEALYPLFTMELADVDSESLSIRYVVGFRYGSMSTLRRGLMKAVPQQGKWMLRSIEEDVREVLLSAARGSSKALDRPRLWFV